MYGNGTGVAGAAGTAGTLAYTGFEAIWWVVGGLTLVFAGIVLIKLVPKWRKKHIN
jgi:hypothetical protein